MESGKTSPNDSVGRASRYIKYAIGEILLVVIGILIALQINNWNTERIEQKRINNYYDRILKEIQLVRNSKERFVLKIEDLKYKNARSLELLNTHNIDSFPLLKHTLGATATSWPNRIVLPITQEFIAQDYLSKVANDSLKLLFQNLVSAFDANRILDETIANQYNNTIEPYFIDNINYSEIALDIYKPNLIQGGPKTDYSSLDNNLQLYNIITFKLELLSSQLDYMESLITLLNRIEEQLEKEI